MSGRDYIQNGNINRHKMQQKLRQGTQAMHAQFFTAVNTNAETPCNTMKAWETIRVFLKAVFREDENAITCRYSVTCATDQKTFRRHKTSKSVRTLNTRF